ncbi:Uncharacterised protein [Candidatus Tiddalikarchaeum anstoanum]|nr:Uncharacterised protein [Candidatus Tiddalikarchaeum anstoanum]
MDEKLKQLLEPWQLKILELIEESKKVNDIIENVADKDSNTDSSKS